VVCTVLKKKKETTMMTLLRMQAVAVFGATTIGLIGCGSDQQSQVKTKALPSIEAVAAEKMRMVEVLETTGNVVATNTVTLEATVEGPISFCPWREGDIVEYAGQKLIEIDRPMYHQGVATAEAALMLARARLDDLKAGARPEKIKQAHASVRHFQDCTEFAKADLDRIRSLVKSGALPAEMEEKARVSYIKCHTDLAAAKEQLAMLKAGPTKTEIAVAQAVVDEAVAKVKLAQAKLDECQLKAPFAGIITEVFVRPGDLATPRARLLKMIDPSSLVVRVGLPENTASDIRTGTGATVRLDAFPNKTFSAKIERVYPRLELDSRTRIIEVRIIEPVELIPRLFARVSVQGRVIEDAIVIPDAAIVTTPRGNKIVYVVKDGAAHMRTVALGMEQENRVQIIDGVQPGEMVIVAGNLNLKDGAQVRLITPAPGVQNNLVQNVEAQSASKMHPIVFQENFPVRIRQYTKTELCCGTIDTICHSLRESIKKHPFALYIGTFDHYSHTAGLSNGFIDADIIDAKIILFCFGKKLNSPAVLSIRPRSIGICETKSKFIISFMAAPPPASIETMEEWVCNITRISPEGDCKHSENGKS
jgi:multidrug resistance efflux pump